MWKFVVTFVLLLVAVPLVPFAVLGELPGETWLEHPDTTYVFCAGVLLLACDIFLPVPSSLIAVSLGARLGLVPGALAASLGLCLGVLVGYAAGWYAGHPLLARCASVRQIAFIRNLENRLGYLALAMVRSVPVLAEASVLAAGAARLGDRRL